jgi:AcrR family transcriptional regulator
VVSRKRPGGRSERVRSAVVMAALEELARGGYSSFSCESVAERAGVNKTTVYRRWGTRENLMLDAMVEGARVSVPILDTRVASSQISLPTPRSSLRSSPRRRSRRPFVPWPRPATETQRSPTQAGASGTPTSSCLRNRRAGNRPRRGSTEDRRRRRNRNPHSPYLFPASGERRRPRRGVRADSG